MGILKNRSRLSASTLTAYERCKNQWFSKYRMGLSSPIKPRMILGSLVEDALCGLMMERAGSSGSGLLRFAEFPDDDSPSSKCETKEALLEWISKKIPGVSKWVYAKGENSFDTAPWKEGSWSDVHLKDIEKYITNGIMLLMAEVEKCHETNLKPISFDIPAPCWESNPHFPVKDKLNQHLKWDIAPRNSSIQSSWAQAWEMARPWVKDPRCFQPQRMYHPEDWAAGECDLVLRWDGNHRIVDIKLSDSSSKFATSLPIQLNFYAWLWNQTHEEKCQGIEGWYLGSCERVQPEMNQLNDDYYRNIYDEMVAFPANNTFPFSYECDASTECFWCSFSNNFEMSFKPMPPCEPLEKIPHRVNVRGFVQGAWGPLPNHFGEPVLGSMIKSGKNMVTLEESRPDAFPKMHTHSNREVTIQNALAGVWRGQPRLYLDDKSKITEIEDLELTRLGMLRTKANVEGIVISCAFRQGNRLDGRPWSMVQFHIWDGKDAAECVCFGASINQKTTSIRVGDHLRIISADIGWRDSLLQLRIDARTTRIEIIPPKD